MQMLDRLRHHAVIGSDDQHDKIDATNPRQHVANEAFVTRYIDESDADAGNGSPVGKAKIDGNPSGLLLRQAIGVDAAQRFYQRSLAVIDVPCSRDDHGALPWSNVMSARNQRAGKSVRNQRTLGFGLSG